MKWLIYEFKKYKDILKMILLFALYLIVFILVSQVIMIMCFLKKKLRRGINYLNDTRSVNDLDDLDN